MFLLKEFVQFDQLLHQTRVFSSGKVLNYNTLDKLLQKTEAYHSLPAKVSQQVLMQVSRDWKGWQQATVSYLANPSKFKGRPRIPTYKDKQNGRNILVYTTQALSKKALKKQLVHFSKTGLKFHTLRKEINQVRIIPR